MPPESTADAEKAKARLFENVEVTEQRDAQHAAALHHDIDVLVTKLVNRVAVLFRVKLLLFQRVDRMRYCIEIVPIIHCPFHGMEVCNFSLER